MQNNELTTMKKKMMILVAVLCAGTAATSAQTGAYRTDDVGVKLVSSSDYENGWALGDMGNDWSQYEQTTFADADTKSITPAMAVANWGSTFTYTVNCAKAVAVDIYVKHGVSWEKYGMAAAETRPANYLVNGNQVDWVKRYAAAMVLEIDGKPVPSAQTSRPVAPAAYETDGSTFNSVLADRSRWTSTLVNNAANDTLWMWPKAGGDNTALPRYNDTPDYAQVELSAGKHVLKVTSLAGVWDFDCMKMVCSYPSGVTLPKQQPEAAFTAFGGHGCIYVESAVPAEIYDMGGRLVDTLTSGKATAVAGVYVVKAGKASRKVVVR